MPTKNGAALRSESTTKRSESTGSSYLEMRQGDQEMASKDMRKVMKEEEEEEEKGEDSNSDYIQIVDRYLGKRRAHIINTFKINLLEIVES
jgi:hypothetical protein